MKTKLICLMTLLCGLHFTAHGANRDPHPVAPEVVNNPTGDDVGSTTRLWLQAEAPPGARCDRQTWQADGAGVG